MSAMIFSDLKCLTCVGNAFCPADSVPEVLQQADYVCKYPAEMVQSGRFRFILKVSTANHLSA